MKKLKIRKDKSILNEPKGIYRFSADEDFNHHSADEFKAKSLEEEIKNDIKSYESQSLKDIGLSSSGYEDYLKSRRKADQKSALTAIDKEYALSDDLETEYKNYLKGYKRAQESIRDRFTDKVIEDGIFDVDKAFNLAVSYGLSDSIAKSAARNATGIAQDRVVREVISYAKANSLSVAAAVRYGKERGLTPMYLTRLNNTLKNYIKHDELFNTDLSSEEYLSFYKSGKTLTNRKEIKMKKETYSSYATNKGGKITSPKGAPKNEPKSTKTTGKDLRIKKG